MNTALHIAVEKGDTHSVNAIIEHCKTNANNGKSNDFLYLKNKSGKTALQLAKEECDKNPDDENLQ